MTPPPRGWPRFLWRFVAALGLLLVPWPGLAQFFSQIVADISNACASVATAAGGLQAEVRFVADRYPEHPWWVQLAVKNVFTAESFDIPVDTRTVAYLRIAVFLALTAAWPFPSKTWREAKAAALGFGFLFALIGLSVLLPTLQVLGIVKLLDLGVLAQSLISIGILTLVTYPSMAFAVPGLVWWLTLQLAQREQGHSADAKKARKSLARVRVVERRGSTR